MPDIEVPDPDDLKEKSRMLFTRRVAPTVTALGGSYAGKGMVMARQKASNQWAYFQAKSVRWRSGSDVRFHTDLGEFRCQS